MAEIDSSAGPRQELSLNHPFKHPRKINGPLKDFPILSPVVQFSTDVHTIGRFEFMNFESIEVSLEETKN